MISYVLCRYRICIASTVNMNSHNFILFFMKVLNGQLQKFGHPDLSNIEITKIICGQIIFILKNIQYRQI